MLDLEPIKAKLAEHEAAGRIDAAWIARQAKLGESVPDLIAEVERLRADQEYQRNELLEEQAVAANLRHEVERLRRERDAYHDQIRRLTDQILMSSTNPDGVDLQEHGAC